MMHNTLITALLGLGLVIFNQAYAGVPSASVGHGYSDMSGVTGSPNPAKPGYWLLKGSLSFTGYGAEPDEVVPAGMHYLSYFAFGAGYEDAAFCGEQGPSYLCNFPVEPGTSLGDAIRQYIPADYVFPATQYQIGSHSLSGICNGWVLSGTRYANEASYVVGSLVCGVRPVDTECHVTPSNININLTLSTREQKTGQAEGSVSCNRAASVRIRTPGIQGSVLRLGQSASAPTAVLSINGQPASDGANIEVQGSTNFVVSANISGTDTSGEYSGSTALVLEYL